MLPNFKALGIEKDIDTHFESIPKSDLSLLIESEYFNHPNITKRENGEIYCNIRVVTCENESWWYSKLIDFEFFCFIRTSFWHNKTIIREYVGCKLLSNRIIIFRGFSPKDVVII